MFTSFGRKYALVVTQDKHVVISTNIDAGMPWRKCYDDNLVYTDWHRDNYFYSIKKVLSDAGVTKGRIGIEYDFMTLETMAELKETLESCEFVNITVPLMRQRMIKTPEEIEHIKNGAYVADIVGFAVREAIAEGVPEYEVALHGTQAMVREIAKLYPQSDLRETWIWFQSGINTDGAHNWPTTRRIQKGDNLILNCFPMMSGYYTALERTLFFDHCDDASLKYWEINVKVHEAGQKLIKVGARCSDICKELNATYDEYGLVPNRTFGYGHSFGVLCHYYGREGLLEIREDIDTILQGTLQETADMLYIHRNTLLKRLEQIERLLGRDIHDPAVKNEGMNVFFVLDYFGISCEQREQTAAGRDNRRIIEGREEIR